MAALRMQTPTMVRMKFRREMEITGRSSPGIPNRASGASLSEATGGGLAQPPWLTSGSPLAAIPGAWRPPLNPEAMPTTWLSAIQVSPTTITSDRAVSRQLYTRYRGFSDPDVGRVAFGEVCMNDAHMDGGTSEHDARTARESEPKVASPNRRHKVLAVTQAGRPRKRGAWTEDGCSKIGGEAETA